MKSAVNISIFVEPKFKAPDYFKGVLMEAMKTNPFKIAAKASVKKPVSTDISDLPGYK